MIPTLAPASAEAGRAWQPWPGHIVAARPACGCGKPAMEWNRCACGTVFARCSSCARGGEALADRRDHNVTCKASSLS